MRALRGEPGSELGEPGPDSVAVKLHEFEVPRLTYPLASPLAPTSPVRRSRWRVPQPGARVSLDVAGSKAYEGEVRRPTPPSGRKPGSDPALLALSSSLWRLIAESRWRVHDVEALRPPSLGGGGGGGGHADPT